jgi:hypothetical protein
MLIYSVAKIVYESTICFPRLLFLVFFFRRCVLFKVSRSINLATLPVVIYSITQLSHGRRPSSKHSASQPVSQSARGMIQVVSIETAAPEANKENIICQRSFFSLWRPKNHLSGGRSGRGHNMQSDKHVVLRILFMLHVSERKKVNLIRIGRIACDRILISQQSKNIEQSNTQTKSLKIEMRT